MATEQEQEQDQEQTTGEDTGTTSEDNMFEGVMDNANAYMGPNYPYYKYIKTPEEIGMSSKGTLSQIGKNVDGLVEYVSLLVSGKSKASATGRPLGNKFFLKTGAKCTNTQTDELTDRYIYVNNVPTGNIPLISSGAGVNFSEFKGLIPGTLSNLNAFNPATMFQAFLMGSNPKCQEVTMQTIDENNVMGTETHYVALVDIKNTDPCEFMDKKNPVSGEKCRETFSVRQLRKEKPELTPMSAFLWISTGIAVTYLVYKAAVKTGAINKIKR